MKMYAYPALGKLPVAAIDKALVLKAIEPIWYTKTETASRVRGRIEAVLDFAKTRGYRTGENPATWDGNLVHALPARNTIAKVQHHAALPFAELPDFMAQLAAREGIAARALEFAILNASRTGEVICSRWSEIDLDAKLWTIPAGRMKAKKEHRVPLTGRSLEILKALPREGDFVFPGGRKGVSISNMAMAEVLKRMGWFDITVHGFRSTFRDWAAERTNYPNHVVEMALAHVVGNKVEAAYRRGDLFAKRARLMGDWAKYCMTRPVETAASNVMPIREGRTMTMKAPNSGGQSGAATKPSVAPEAQDTAKLELFRSALSRARFNKSIGKFADKAFATKDRRSEGGLRRGQNAHDQRLEIQVSTSPRPCRNLPPSTKAGHGRGQARASRLSQTTE